MPPVFSKPAKRKMTGGNSTGEDDEEQDVPPAKALNTGRNSVSQPATSYSSSAHSRASTAGVENRRARPKLNLPVGFVQNPGSVRSETAPPAAGAHTLTVAVQARI